MTRQKLDPRLKKFKRILLAGNSIASASKELKIGKSTGYSYAQQLEFLGEIRRIPGTKNPLIYEDAKRPLSGNAGTVESPGNDYGVVQYPETAPLSRPDKMVRAHISGAYVVQVETVGDRGGRIADGQGYTIGGWHKTERLVKKTRVHDGFLYGHHETIKFILYLASEGPKLNIYPRPRPVYYKTATIEGPKAMENQVLEVCRNLERYGWKFRTRPALAGVMHYGDIDPRLLGIADPMHDFDGAAVHTDTSPGYPEIEIYDDHETAQRDIVILSELPDRIIQITDALTETTNALMVISDTAALLQENQARIIELVASGQQQTAYKPFDGVGYL